MTSDPADREQRDGAAGEQPAGDPYDIAGYFGIDDDDDDDEVIYGRTADGGYTATFRVGPRVMVAPSLPEGPRPEPPPGLSAQAKARREMAEQLADDLVDPPYRLEGLTGHDWAHAALEVPLAYPPVWQAYEESNAVIKTARRIAGEITISEGWDGTGVVVRAHGPDWSLVLASNGPERAVFLCRDDMPDVPLRIEPEGQRERILFAFWFAAVFALMQHAVFGGDYIPPEFLTEVS